MTAHRCDRPPTGAGSATREARRSPRMPVFTGTAAELRARLDERAVYARRIFEAMMRGDHDGCAEAQAEMRRAFPDGRL